MDARRKGFTEGTREKQGRNLDLENPSLSSFPSVKSSVSLLPFTAVLQEIPCEVTQKVGFAALNG